MSDPLLKYSEVCKYLGLSKSTVQRLMSSGALMFRRVGLRGVRFLQTDVDAYVSNSRRGKFTVACQSEGVAAASAKRAA